MSRKSWQIRGNLKILSYQHKPARQDPHTSEMKVLYSSNRDGGRTNLRPKNRHLPQSATKVLDAPGILDDFYSHPVDWSSQNVVAVALGDMVFLFDASTGSTKQLLQLSSGSITTLRWTESGRTSIGLVLLKWVQCRWSLGNLS